ncbi:MAG: hypothetical protein R3C24_15995 [Cyanobacteriota/Melainabacteria group bacterium]
MLDACHSGVAAPSSKGLHRVCNVDPDKVVQGTGQLVITSSKPSQRSRGVFQAQRQCLHQTSNRRAEKRRESTPISVKLLNYLESQVQREVLRDRGLLQTPVMKSKWSGNELIIGVPPTNPSTGLPAVELPDRKSQATIKAQPHQQLLEQERVRILMMPHPRPNPWSQWQEPGKSKSKKLQDREAGY